MRRFIVALMLCAAAAAQTGTVRHSSFHARSGMVLDLTLSGQNATDQVVVTVGGIEVYRKSGGITGHERAAFDLSKIAVGNYTMKTALQDVKGAERWSSSETVTKDVNGKPTVSIDQYNNILLNGTGLFPVTPFLLNPCASPSQTCTGTWIPTYANQGGWMTGYDSTYNVATYQTFLTNLLTYSASGTRMIGPDGDPGSCRWGPGDCTNDNPTNTSTIAGYASTLKNDPRIFMWTWIDEPEIYGVVSATTTSWANTTRANDPNHPVALNQYGYNPDLTNSRGFLTPGNADVMGFDVYPVGSSYANCTNGYSRMNMTQYAAAMDSFRSLSSDLQPWIPIVEIAEDHGAGNGPNAAQVFMEAWLMVVHGAKGVSWWHPWGTVPSGNFTAAQTFTSQVSRLQSILTAVPGAHVATSNSTAAGNRVDVMAKEDASSVWVIAVRLTDFASCSAVLTPDNSAAIATQITVSGLTNATATVMDENRTVSVASGMITDTFAPYAVHIYQIPKGTPPKAPQLGAPVVH